MAAAPDPDPAVAQRPADDPRTLVLTFLAIRLAVWGLVVLGLVWAPLRGDQIPPFRAYNGLTDLVFGAFAQWDSVWFIHLSEFGYDSEQITAFFPLYPLLVQGLAWVTGSTIVAGVLISLAAGCVAIVLLPQIAPGRLSPEVRRDAVLLATLYPLAFVFTAIYSDGLFLALALGAFVAAERRRPLLAGVLAALAVDTRLVGLALIVPLVVLLWPRNRSPRELFGVAVVAALPTLGFGLYTGFLHQRFGDWLMFVHAEGHETWDRHVPTLGPVSGLWQAASAAWHGSLELFLHLPRAGAAPEGFPAHDTWAMWNVVQFLVLVAAIWLTWLAWKRLGAAYGLYSTGLILIILASPADLVPLVSSPRYLLADFPLFLVLADLLHSRPHLRQGTLYAFASLSAVAAVAFSHKVWIA